MQIRRVRLIYTLLVISLAGHVAHAQSPKPNTPDLYYVTVIPETGDHMIEWLPVSTPPDFEYYQVAYIEILNPNEPPVYQPLAIVRPPDTYFLNTSPPDDRPVGYTVWAVSSDGTAGSFEEPDSTLFLEPLGELDPCQPSITLIWNDYNKWRGNIEEYVLHCRQDGGPWATCGVFDEGQNQTSRSLEPNKTYDFYIEAFHSDGLRSSKSNMFSHNSGDVSPGPESINADYATLGLDGGIDLSFTASSAGQFEYILSRSSDPLGPFLPIQQITSQSSDSIFTFHDNISFTSGRYYYRLEVPNECGGTGKVSNLASNVLLNGTIGDMNIMLSWNDYFEWNGGVQQYTVTRTAGVENPVVDIFSAGLTTSLNDDITSLVDYSDPLENKICYQVEAIENPNILGTQGTSTSNLICFNVDAGIRVPNAIVPNDPDNRFEPVFAFEPERYELVIYNRLGLKVWEGENIPWDGTINGTYAPEGVYLYYFRIFNYSSDISELSGSVTVVYR